MDKKIYVLVEEYINRLQYRVKQEEWVDVTAKVDPKIAVRIQEKRMIAEKEEGLYEMIRRYINRLGRPEFYRKNGELNEAAFYRYAWIDKSTWSDIRWEKIIPQKKTLLKLVIALELNEEEASELLRKGSSCFNIRDPRDQIILALIDIKCYNYQDVYDVLEEYRLNGTRPFENIYDVRDFEIKRD